MNKFVYGSYIYNYDLQLQNRKTISITVQPDLNIIVKAPSDATNEKIEKFLKKKWFWLEKQLSYFKNHKRKIYRREYVTGEGFLYLGKQYRLVIRNAKKNAIKLTKKDIVLYLIIGISMPIYSKAVLKEWYKKEIQRVFKERLLKNIKLFSGQNTPILTIREMKKRWGSFIGNGQIILNPKLIHASEDCIDYVIIHELCHMVYKNHGKDFYNLLYKKYPSWEKVKEKLESYQL